jgi:two-component system, sensor histidine kinase and response regulator
MKQTNSSTFDEKIMSSGLTDFIFDWDGLLHRLMGDEDLAKEIINDYLKQIPLNFNAVKEASNKKYGLLLKREVHTIKSASENIGALALQKIAEQIEIPGEDNDLVRAELFISQLDAQLDKFKRTLTQFKT